MGDLHLYQQIVESIRQGIFSGRLKPGDRLPTIRQMTSQWGCTNATVHRAYRELARQGLVTSHVGKGTNVASKLPDQGQLPLRRALLLNRIEASLLEHMTAGYTPDEVEQAIRIALDRWRTLSASPDDVPSGVLRFVGSHDPAITLIASMAGDIMPGLVLQLTFTGSLAGLIALMEGDADIAGCHLWDGESDTYNAPFIRRLFPGQEMAILTLAQRQVGLIVPPGNPLQIEQLQDLTRPGVKFVNRQPGSGTRVWLDSRLKAMGVDPKSIVGYQDERMTHTEIASEIAKGTVNAGVGIQAAALVYGLGFVQLNKERYELAIPIAEWERPTIQGLYRWLTTTEAVTAIGGLGGYDTSQTGSLTWVS